MSSPLFAKLAADLHSNPKIRKAGRNAREVYIFALCRNVFRGHDGVLPSDDLDPDYIADQLQMTEIDARDGLDRAIAARLLKREGHAVMIVGWEEFWGKTAKTEAERKKNQRERESDRLRKVTKVSGQVTMWSGHVTNPSGHDRDMSGPKVTERDKRVGEERRGEEIRQEDKDPPQAGVTRITSVDNSDAPHYADSVEPHEPISAWTAQEPGGPFAEPTPLPEGGEPAIVAPGASGEPVEVLKPHKREPLPDALTLAELLYGLIAENNPGGRQSKFTPAKRAHTITLWALEIEKLHRIDRVEWGTIHNMIEWCQREPFWRTVILGGANLRDKWDTMQAQRTRRIPQKAPQGRGMTNEIDDAVRTLNQKATS